MSDPITQPTVSADAEPVAVIRFDRGAPGNENEMPKVISCDWQPDGEYRLYTETQMQTRADAAWREGEQAGLEKALKFADEATDECARWKQPGTWVAKSIATAIRALKENPNAG